MTHKEVRFRLTSEEYDEVEKVISGLGVTIHNYAKKRLLSVKDDENLDADKMNILLGGLIDMVEDNSSGVESLRLMLKIVMQQTWTLLQAVSMSSDEDGRQELKKLYAISQEHVEKILNKIKD